MSAHTYSSCFVLADDQFFFARENKWRKRQVGWCRTLHHPAGHIEFGAMARANPAFKPGIDLGWHTAQVGTACAATMAHSRFGALRRGDALVCGAKSRKSASGASLPMRLRFRQMTDEIGLAAPDHGDQHAGFHSRNIDLHRRTGCLFALIGAHLADQRPGHGTGNCTAPRRQLQCKENRGGLRRSRVLRSWSYPLQCFIRSASRCPNQDREDDFGQARYFARNPTTGHPAGLSRPDKGVLSSCYKVECALVARFLACIRRYLKSGADSPGFCAELVL